MQLILNFILILLIFGQGLRIAQLNTKLSNLEGYAQEERACRHFAIEKLSKTFRNWDTKLRRRVHILERKVRHINKGPVQIPESLMKE